MWREKDYDTPDTNEDETPLYSEDSAYISLKINHGGGFFDIPSRVYGEGEVDYFDFVDPAFLTLNDLTDYVEKIGYSSLHRLYYRVPGESLDNGLAYIDNERVVNRMVESLNEYRIIEIFTIGSQDSDLLESVNDGAEDLVEVGINAQAGYMPDGSDYELIHDSDYASSDEDDKLFEKYMDKEIESAGWCKFGNENKQGKAKKNSHNSSNDQVLSGSDVDYASVFELGSEGSTSDEGGTLGKKAKVKSFNPETNMDVHGNKQQQDAKTGASCSSKGRIHPDHEVPSGTWKHVEIQGNVVFLSPPPGTEAAIQYMHANKDKFGPSPCGQGKKM